MLVESVVLVALLQAPPAKVNGTLQENKDGEFLFIDKNAEAFEIDPDEKWALKAARLNLPVVGVKKRKKTGTDSVVDDIQLEAFDIWQKQRGALTASKYTALATAVNEFTQETTTWQTLVAVDLQSTRGVIDKLETVQEKLALAFMSTKEADTLERAALVRLAVTMERSRKAFYGHADIFTPVTYQNIFDKTHAAVGLAVRALDDVRCSGVLVSRDRVLTALHCLEHFRPDEYDVWFNWDGGGAAKEVWQVDATAIRGTALTAVPGTPVLDFALLKVKPNAGGKLPAVKPACLSTRRVRRDEAVYLVGHPNGTTKMVHDNAFVLFPFQVTNVELGTLKLAVEAELRGLSGARSSSSKTTLKEFIDSYVQNKPPPGGDTLFENYSRRWGRQPTIGVDSDTSHGDSGSPMFGRRDHTVIGLLSAGEEDRPEAYTPGWKAHEAVVPMSAIVAQLDTLDPTWRQGACVSP